MGAVGSKKAEAVLAGNGGTSPPSRPPLGFVSKATAFVSSAAIKLTDIPQSFGAKGPTSTAEDHRAATLLQSHARGSSTRKVSQERTRAAVVIQNIVRKKQATLAPADLRIARAYADSLMPRDTAGNLYTTCSRVEWAAYDDLGTNIGLYMRFLWWGLQICGACTCIAVVPIVLNLSGDGEFLRPSNAIFTYHTLGNAPDLHWLQGACDCATSLLLLVGLVYKQRQFRLLTQRQRDHKHHKGGAALSVTDYTLQIDGLPKTTTLDGQEVRAHFEAWGEVVAVSVSRAQRSLLMLLQARDFAHGGETSAEATLLRHQKSMRLQGLRTSTLKAAASAFERAVAQCGAGASGRVIKKAWADAWADITASATGDVIMMASFDAAPPADIETWLAFKLQLHAARSQLHKIEAKVVKLKKQPTPCTGIAFVTFNEQRAAHACLEALRPSSEQQLAKGGLKRLPTRLEGCRLKARFATHPDNIIWENLQVTWLETFLRGFAVNAFMLILVCFNSVCIVLATNVNSRKALDDSIGAFEKLTTTIWSTVVVIVGNVSIFALTPNLALLLERYHTADERETAMLRKMCFFQCLNFAGACFCFLWCLAFVPGLDQAACPAGHESHFWPDWYYTGGATAFNVLLGDVVVVIGLVEGLRLFDKLPIRHLAARFAVTQQRMNAIYAFQAAPEIPDPGMIYFPFRLQLILKYVVMGLAFTPALPGIFPLTGLMFLLSFYVDKFNFLRIFHIPATSDKIIAAIMLDYFPLGIALKAILAPFFFHHKAMHLLHAAELSTCAATFSLGGANEGGYPANATAEAAARNAARAECEADFVSHGGGSRREPTPRGLSPLSVLSEETLFEPTVLISLVS